MVTYVLTDEEDLNSIADAIRTKNGDENATYRPSEMAPAILEIKGGGIEELPNNLAYLGQTIADGEFIGYGSSVTVDKTGAEMGEINPILQALYPIGSIYMSVTYFDPATVFGGVWERISGRFLLAADDSYAAGATGGSATHSHNVTGVAQITIASSSYVRMNQTKASKSYKATVQGAATYSTNESSLTTGANLDATADEASSLPPYLAVYMWQRTA